MKSFLEEYGFAILVAIVVILLIAMASPIGDIVKAQITNIINRFSENAMAKLDKAEMENDAKAVLSGGKITVTATSTTDEFECVLHYVTKGVATDTAKADLTNVQVDSKNTLINELDLSATIDTADKGSEYYVTVTNKGTGESFDSNRLVK